MQRKKNNKEKSMCIYITKCCKTVAEYIGIKKKTALACHSAGKALALTNDTQTIVY